MDMAIRLNKLLSMYGVASRRAADALITQGRVELNGRVVYMWTVPPRTK